MERDMTAQFPDQFLINETEYSIAGIHGEPPFDPVKLGMHPISTCTACWRGYVAGFALREDQLVLARLSIQLGKLEEGSAFIPQVGPEINGREPALPVDRHAMFNNVYDPLDLPLQFDGGLLIARDFIQELYVHMGFHPAWKFNEVWELVFDGGHLESAENVSDKVAVLRQKLNQKSLIPPSGKRQQKWIHDAFRLDY
jgi:hypothetical protein